MHRRRHGGVRLKNAVQLPVQLLPLEYVAKREHNAGRDELYVNVLPSLNREILDMNPTDSSLTGNGTNRLNPRVGSFFAALKTPPYRYGNFDWYRATINTSEFGNLRVTARADGKSVMIEFAQSEPPIKVSGQGPDRVIEDNTPSTEVLFSAAEKAAGISG